MSEPLPGPIAEATSALFEHLPLDSAMSALVVAEPADEKLAELVAGMIDSEPIASRPPLIAALWLYIDELDRSHRVSQSIDDSTGSFWHGIMHRREGDFGNSHYWFRRVGHHPAFQLIDVPGGYDPHAVIDQVEAVHQRGETSDALIETQRREWMTLFQWCARRT